MTKGHQYLVKGLVYLVSEKGARASRFTVDRVGSVLHPVEEE